MENDIVYLWKLTRNCMVYHFVNFDDDLNFFMFKIPKNHTLDSNYDFQTVPFQLLLDVFRIVFFHYSEILGKYLLLKNLPFSYIIFCSPNNLHL